MIANEGYVPLSMLIEREFYDLEEEAKSYLLETSSSILALAVHRPGDIARSWLFRYFSSDLYLTNGFDNPIKIDSNLVTSTHYHVDLSSRLLRDHEAPDLDIPKDMATTFSFCKPLSEEIVEQFNVAAQNISEAETEAAASAFEEECEIVLGKELAVNGFTRPYLFVDWGMLSIDLSLYDFLADQEDFDVQHHTSEDVHKQAKILRGFDGYFLATTETKAGDDLKSYCKTICQIEIAERRILISLDESKEVKGRPRKQESALKAYFKAFPDGHKGTIWKEVEAITSEILGEPVSSQTIKTALKSSKE